MIKLSLGTLAAVMVLSPSGGCGGVNVVTAA